MTDIANRNYNDVVDAVVDCVRAGDIDALDELKSFEASDEEDMSPSEIAAIAMVEDLKSDLFSDIEAPPANTSDHKLPAVYNGFHIVREIGRGGMAVVYEARQESLDRRIAIKVLMRTAEVNNFGQRFHLEAKATSNLRHPNIVSAFDYGIEDGNFWLAMPYVDGVCLDHVCTTEERPRFEQLFGSKQKGATHYTRVARIGIQVANALAYAHDEGVIHRDIKPGNLILTEGGKVWVTDFGLAKLRDEDRALSTTGDMIGTPRYMAPEQIRGLTDERSDIYSLGVTLWELATGERAWDGFAVASSTHSTNRLAPVRSISPDVPESLAQIIDKACEPDAVNRFKTARELEHTLNRFVYGNVGDRRGVDRNTSYLSSYRWPIALALAFVVVTGLLLQVSKNGISSNALAVASRGTIHLKHSETGWFLNQDEDGKNVVTRPDPDPWEFVVLRVTNSGNEVVQIRNLRSGMHLDFDDSDFNVDMSSSTKVDKDHQWELLPAENGRFLIRNRELGSYLHDEGSEADHNVNGSPTINSNCEWIVKELPATD